MNAKNYLNDKESWRNAAQSWIGAWNDALIFKTTQNGTKEQVEAEETEQASRQNGAASYVLIALALVAALVVILLLRKKK